MLLSSKQPFLDNPKLSITDAQEHLWSAEMMKCFSDAVPDYAERMRSLVLLSKAIFELEHVDTESVLGIWGTRWMECWQDLPADPREALSEQVGYATCDAWISECI